MLVYESAWMHVNIEHNSNYINLVNLVIYTIYVLEQVIICFSILGNEFYSKNVIEKMSYQKKWCNYAVKSKNTI